MEGFVSMAICAEVMEEQLLMTNSLLPEGKGKRREVVSSYRGPMVSASSTQRGLLT